MFPRSPVDNGPCGSKPLPLVDSTNQVINTDLKMVSQGYQILESRQILPGFKPLILPSGDTDGFGGFRLLLMTLLSEPP